MNFAAAVKLPLDANQHLRDMNFVVFSHLRWNFVFQRPQHLMTRCARTNNVFFCEEPVFDAATPYWDISFADSGVRVAVPHLPSGIGCRSKRKSYKPQW